MKHKIIKYKTPLDVLNELTPSHILFRKVDATRLKLAFGIVLGLQCDEQLHYIESFTEENLVRIIQNPLLHGNYIKHNRLYQCNRDVIVSLFLKHKQDFIGKQDVRCIYYGHMAIALYIPAYNILLTDFSYIINEITIYRLYTILENIAIQSRYKKQIVKKIEQTLIERLQIHDITLAERVRQIDSAQSIIYDSMIPFKQIENDIRKLLNPVKSVRFVNLDLILSKLNNNYRVFFQDDNLIIRYKPLILANTVIGLREDDALYQKRASKPYFIYDLDIIYTESGAFNGARGKGFHPNMMCNTRPCTIETEICIGDTNMIKLPKDNAEVSLWRDSITQLIITLKTVNLASSYFQCNTPFWDDTQVLESEDYATENETREDLDEDEQEELTDEDADIVERDQEEYDDEDLYNRFYNIISDDDYSEDDRLMRCIKYLLHNDENYEHFSITIDEIKVALAANVNNLRGLLESHLYAIFDDNWDTMINCWDNNEFLEGVFAL